MATSAPQFPPDAPSLGEGRYVLVSRIGEGAVGAVYRAYDRKLRVWRAVKVLLPQAAAHDWVREQFEADAHTLAQLEHPNLVRVYDVGRAGDQPFVVMELVDGGTLAYWVAKNGAVPPRVACDAVLQVVHALCAVHAHGVVHGGVKPGNVLVAPNGSCKLTDFGIVAPAEGSGHAAPEQVDGSPIDARADLYGVGATLWHLLRGQDPSGRAVEFGGIPAVLHPIILGCTAGDPNDRFPTGHDLAAALEEAIGHLPADRAGTPDLCLDRSEEEVEVAGQSERFDELEPLLDDARPRAAAKPLPYTMPPDDPQRRRSALMTPAGGGPEAAPEWLDDRAGQTPGAPRQTGQGGHALPSRTTPPPSYQPSATTPSATPPTVAARVTPEPVPPAKPRATPAPAPPARPAPDPIVEAEDPPSRLVTWVLVPLGLLVAAVMCVVLVFVVVAGMGMSALSDAADATTLSQIELYRVLNEERRLVDDLAGVGADRAVLEQAYVTYLEETVEPARIGAALALARAVDEQSSGRLDEAMAGTEQAEIAKHLRQVRAARMAYDAAVQQWRQASEGRTGKVLVSIGLGPAPP